MRDRILSIVIALVIGMGLAGFSVPGEARETQPDTSLAGTYRVLGENDLSTGSGRTAKEWCIFSSADSFAKRAQTAIQAAIDLQEKSGAAYVSVKLTPIPKVGCGRYLAATAVYAPDGLGIKGKKSRPVWSVSSSSILLGPEEVLVAMAWEEARPKIEVNGKVNPDTMAKYLSKQLNLTPLQVRNYWLRCLEMGMTLRQYPVDTVPAAPKGPGTQNAPDAPNIQSIPAVPNAPDIPGVSSIPPVPTIPTVPKIPAAPKPPATPKAPDTRPPT